MDTDPARRRTNRLPSRGELRTLADVDDAELRGSRVLISADIDVARRQTSKEFHFKIARLADSVRHLLDRGAVVLVLGAQGSTAVRVLESGNTQDLEWHRRALARELAGERTVHRVDRIDDLTTDPRPGTVTLLPNLAELSREDDAVFAGGDTEDGALVHDACENALLPTLLRDRFDFFVLDDFRSTIRALPSNIGLAAGKPCAVGIGLQRELESLADLVARSRALGGTEGRRDRICFVGSSRPQDADIACALLADGLFDRAVLGPMPSLMVYQELGYALGAGPSADLASLIRTHRMSAVTDSLVPAFVTDNRNRLVLPTDFMVANRAGRGRARRVTPEGLGELAEDDRVMSIGSETLKTFADETDRAQLVFHFGMMSAGHRPYIAYTEAVIRANLLSDAEVYMAGDHILEIAHDMGLVNALSGWSTGAKTASSLLCGSRIPGIAPFRKPDPGTRSAATSP